jgi:hypothetical protein
MFEDLTLTPSTGHVDVSEVHAWLAAQRHAFHDPASGDGWHMSATAMACEARRLARLADPSRFSCGVRIIVSPSEIYINALCDRDEMARVLQLLEWLASRRAWDVRRDCMQPEPLGDPRRLFEADLIDPALLDHDPTLPPVTEGTLTTYTAESGVARTFTVHSGGLWRYDADERRLRGHLSDSARATWNAAVAALESLNEVAPSAEPETAVRIEVETADALDSAEFTPAALPAYLLPLLSMISAWTAWLDAWSPRAAGVTHQDLAGVRLA